MLRSRGVLEGACTQIVLVRTCECCGLPGEERQRPELGAQQHEAADERRLLRGKQHGGRRAQPGRHEHQRPHVQLARQDERARVRAQQLRGRRRAAEARGVAVACTRGWKAFGLGFIRPPAGRTYSSRARMNARASAHSRSALAGALRKRVESPWPARAAGRLSV